MVVWLCHLQTGHLTSRSLGFLICEMGIKSRVPFNRIRCLEPVKMCWGVSRCRGDGTATACWEEHSLCAVGQGVDRAGVHGTNPAL